MSVRRSLVWMFASQGGLFFLQFGGSVALAHLLTPYEMGVYAIAAAVIGVIGVIQAFGLALFVIREANAGLNILDSAFTMNVVLSVLLAAAVVGLSVFGGAFLNEPGVRNVMLVLAIIPLIGVFEFRPITMIERAGEFRAIASLNVVRAISSTIVTVWLAFVGQSYMSIAWGAVAGSAAGAIGAMIIGWRHVSLRVSFTAWRTLLQFGMRQMAIQGINMVSGKLSEFVLGRLLGLEALGLWGRASSLNNLVWYNIHAVVGRVMLVNLSERHRAGQSLRSAYLRTLEVSTVILWPSFAGLAILAKPFIAVVYGEAWLSAAPPLVWLSFGSCIMVSLAMSWEVFIVCNETGQQARLEYYRTAIGLILFVLGSCISLTFAALGRLFEAICSVVIYRPHVERMTDTRWADYALIYRRNAIVTAVACSPALILMLAYDWSSGTPVSLVALAVVLGMAFWLIALRASNHPLFSEIGRAVTEGRQRLKLS